MTVTADYNFLIKAVESVSLGIDGVTNPDVELALSGLSGRLDATTPAPASKAFLDQIPLVGGAATIDLTALAKGNLPNVDFTGLKVQLVAIFAAVANTAAFVIDKGATNGYELFGDANGQIALPAGASAALFLNEGLADVSAAVKDVDLSSTDTDAVATLLLVAG